jgi:hypothetical protein
MSSLIILIIDAIDANWVANNTANSADWHRISIEQLQTSMYLQSNFFSSISFLIRKVKHCIQAWWNLGGSLQYAYPEVNWDLSKFSVGEF